MKLRWSLWFAATLLMAAYVVAGYLASRTDAVSIKLEPGAFEAMPKGSHSSDRIGRDLTSSLSIGPGIWRWPPPADRPRILLHAGVTPVTLSIEKVDAPLAGETVELLIHPALGLKSSEMNVSWLWFWFLWPFMAAIQLLWAAALILLARRKR